MQVYLARNLLKLRRYAEAEPLLRECLKFREQNDSDDWATFNTRSMLGGSLLGQKKYAEAEPMLLAGYEGMKQREATIFPVGKIRLTEAIERLVQLYEATGEPGKAAVWRARLGQTDSARRRLRPAVNGPASEPSAEVALDRPMNPRNPAAGG